MEWLKNLSNAIEYIETHLADDICYEEAAKIACCSSYYFQRMFTYVAGISLSEYIRRRRMTQAAFDIQTQSIKILDVALKYGYTSPTAFNRAFQKVHGIAPTAAKAKGSLLNAYPPIQFSVSTTGGHVMTYRVEEKEAMRIVGIRLPLTMDMTDNQRNVPPFWERTLRSNSFTQICELSTDQPLKILGVTVLEHDNCPYYYIASQTDAPVPDGMFECLIPKATWVIFKNHGFYKESVQEIFRRFLTEWLPFSGFTYAELPDIEVYPITNEVHPSGHSEVWIAIRKEKERS